jgi:iron complex transport system permease protein
MKSYIKVSILILSLLIFSFIDLYLNLGSFEILYKIRLPRLFGILIVGFSLSTAGLLLQMLTKNSLADPFIIGTSSGSMLGIIVCEMLALSHYNIVFFITVNLFALFFTLVSYRLS